MSIIVGIDRAVINPPSQISNVICNTINKFFSFGGNTNNIKKTQQKAAQSHNKQTEKIKNKTND